MDSGVGMMRSDCDQDDIMGGGRSMQPLQSTSCASRCDHDGGGDGSTAPLHTPPSSMDNAHHNTMNGSIDSMGDDSDWHPHQRKRRQRHYYRCNNHTNMHQLLQIMISLLMLGCSCTVSIFARPTNYYYAATRTSFVHPTSSSSFLSRSSNNHKPGPNAIDIDASLSFVSSIPSIHHQRGSINKINNINRGIKYAAHDDYHDSSSINKPEQQPMIEKLNSFSTNISRLRMAKKKQSLSPKKKGIKSTKSSNDDDAIIGACTSLLYYLREETERIMASSTSSSSIFEIDNTNNEGSMKEMLEMVLIQSIRATSEVGDFVLLQKLVYAAVDYARAILSSSEPSSSTDGNNDRANNIGNSPLLLLSPRMFGEAFTSLSKTKASISKLKSLWNYFVYDVATGVVVTSSEPPSYAYAYELNAMLGALRERKKYSAAIKLYYRHAVIAPTTTTTSVDGTNTPRGVVIKGDAYTASILFGMLADSISNGGYVNFEEEHASETQQEETQHTNTSPSPQWNQALSILNTFEESNQLNNYAYAALLKVNDMATKMYGSGSSSSGSSGELHSGVKCAMHVLDRMKKDKISPDVITCSTLLTTFDKCRNWKAAMTLLNAMQQASKNQNSTSWSLPPPNTYTYSLVIATCARCHQGELALSLLDQMTSSSSSISNEDEVVVHQPNTWVYNAALLACAESSSSRKKLSKDKSGVDLITAFDILDKMETDDNSSSSSSSDNVSPPDTVSYNTALSVLDENGFRAAKEAQAQCEEGIANNGSRLWKHDAIVDIIMGILDTMESNQIPRDVITYYNAIMSCPPNSSDGHNEGALQVLRRAFSDSDFVGQTEAMMKEPASTSSSSSSSKTYLKGRAASGLIFVVNAALSVASTTGDVYAVSQILSMISELDNNTKLNPESMKYIIRTLGKIDDCDAILALMISLRGQDFANDILKERYSIDVLSNLSEKSLPMIEEQVYSAAITSCLRNDELGMADHIFTSMKKNGLTLDQRSLKEIISEYCRMAMTSSKDEFKIARLAKRQEKDTSKFGIVEPVYITSRARAKAALTMLKAVEKPHPPSLLSPIAKACCAAGLWQEARSILRRMHRAAIHEVRVGSYDLPSSRRVNGQFLDELPRLHRSLLKFCAKGGSITPALNFADDIQFLASQIREHGKSLRGSSNIMIRDEEKSGDEPELITLSSRLLMDSPTPDNIPETDFSNVGALSSILERPVGLTGQDWKLILIAASRGGHWKVCVGTLPFIRPYVKETHPMYACESFESCDLRRSRPSMERLNKKYDRIARALTAAILCFEARSQYAWAIRAIDDWIEWSGRRPRKEAVASACRVLAKRYRGQEVLQLVTKVMNIPATESVIDNDKFGDDADEASDYTYEKAVYTEAINALHKRGLYVEADQLYAEAIANGHLPWAVISSDKKQLRLDLHGMSAAVAHSAVRVSLQRETMESSDGDTLWSKDVLIITGRGRRSGERFKPVLRPEVQRMLTEEFYPPLSTSSIRGNLGALLVPAADIQSWLEYQQQQKGDRMLFVADMLRGISSGNRLENALRSASGTSRLEKALRMKLEAENRGSHDSSEDQ